LEGKIEQGIRVLGEKNDELAGL